MEEGEITKMIKELNKIFYPYYEIISLLGVGGEAKVFRARHLNLGREVALKLIKKSVLMGDENIKRFQHEARIMANLDHPAIVKIYDAGQKEDFYYIAMEILGDGSQNVGKTLSHLISNTGSLDNQTIVSILNTLLDGLKEIHSSNVIHRDIKSNNIMFNNRGIPVLMDFGISKSASQDYITVSDSMYFTPEYASPEQIDRPKEADHRTDIYSIGVVAYHMATGTVPFYDPNKIKVVNKVLSEEAKEPRSINPALSKNLASFIKKCMEKNPAERYQSVDEMLVALNGDTDFKIKTFKWDSFTTYNDQKLLIGLVGALTLLILLFIGFLWLRSGEEDTLFDKNIASRTNDKQREVSQFSNPVSQQKERPQTGATSSGSVHKPAVNQQKQEEKHTEITQQQRQTRQEEPAITQQADVLWKDLGIKLAGLVGGVFQMGDNQKIGGSDTKPPHMVRVNDFWVSKHEITQHAWQLVMGYNPSRNTNCPECPVENVSWDDAQRFIAKLNEITGKEFRLPTEAEWEYMASETNPSGSGAFDYYLFAGSTNISDVAWYNTGDADKTQIVGKKRANKWGIYDLTGNVREWCADWYDENAYAAYGRESNPQGPPSGQERVIRGGSFKTPERKSRIFDRDKAPPNSKYNDLGFRIVTSNKFNQ
jgi:formylglycine-generating enzyme